MNVKMMGNVAKGVGIGMAVGAVAGAVGYGCLCESKKGTKNSVGKALHNVSRFVDNVGNMF